MMETWKVEKKILKIIKSRAAFPAKTELFSTCKTNSMSKSA